MSCGNDLSSDTNPFCEDYWQNMMCKGFAASRVTKSDGLSGLDVLSNA